VTQRHTRSRTVDAELVEYVVAVLPDGDAVAELMPALDDLVRRDTVRLLDGAIVARDDDGTTHVAELPSSTDATTVLPTHRGLLSEHDLRLTAEVVPVGSVGVVIVIEDSWARPLADAARRAGGQLAGGERIPPGRLGAIIQSTTTTQGGSA
jgi:hypothetical protein